MATTEMCPDLVSALEEFNKDSKIIMARANKETLEALISIQSHKAIQSE